MPYYHIHILATPFILGGQEWPSTRHTVGTAHSATRANTCHTIFKFILFYDFTMSNDISKIVERIHKDVCEDCKNKCGLCDEFVCEDVVIEIGSFFIFASAKEIEEQEKQ